MHTYKHTHMYATQDYTNRKRNHKTKKRHLRNPTTEMREIKVQIKGNRFFKQSTFKKAHFTDKNNGYQMYYM